jgi:hypothetical protein
VRRLPRAHRRQVAGTLACLRRTDAMRQGSDFTSDLARTETR